MANVIAAVAETIAPAEKPSNNAEKNVVELGAVRDHAISFTASCRARRSSGPLRVSMGRLRQVMLLLTMLRDDAMGATLHFTQTV